MFNSKHRTLLAFLSTFKVELYINLTTDGVVFPKRDMDTASVFLSTRFEGDLILYKDKVVAELSFNKKKVLCTIPYDAIWSIRPVANKDAEGEPTQEELDEVAEFYDECVPLSMREKYGMVGKETPQ